MSEGGWDDDDFEPPAPVVGATDKWEGEDEGEDVKDSWDAEDGEKTEEAPPEMRAVQRKKKKPLAERIAEKEAARLAAEQKEREENRELTKEEKRAEAERLRKIQEEADLKLAKEAFGVSEPSGIDAMFPETEEDFIKFKAALKGKILSFNSSPHYSSFLEKLIQDLVLDLNTEELKRLSTSTSSIYHEKQRLQKEAEKKKKKKGKDTIKIERRATDFGDISARDDFYEDDFI